MERFEHGRSFFWLFAHAATFYSFVLRRLPAENLSGVLGRFRGELGHTLFHHEFTAPEIHFALQSLEGSDRIEGRVSNGMKRSIEALWDHYRWFLETDRSVWADEHDVSREMNDMPLEMLHHEVPAEAFRRHILIGLETRRRAA